MVEEIKTEQKTEEAKPEHSYKIMGLLGKKLGMSSVFDQSGRLVPVTIIETGPCVVLGVKNYPGKKSILLGFSDIDKKRLNKPQAGLFEKLKVTPKKFIQEIMIDKDADFNVGQELRVDILKNGDFVDVIGRSIGKGFQGGMKRWGWHGGPQTHGSMSHRRIGAISSGSNPGRTIKGHHFPGHMGARRVTVKNLEVVSVDLENNLLALEGAVPGHKNSLVVVKKAKKQKK